MSSDAASAAANTTSTTTPTKRARRPRAIQACNFCRTKKYRCDGNLPCVHCRKHGLDCVFRKPEAHDPEAAAYSISYVKQLERRLELAEAELRQHQQSGSSASATASPQGPKSVQAISSSKSTGTGTGSLQSSVFASPLSDDHGQHQQLPSRAGEESDESVTEMVDVNSDTNAVEFHGNTSSLAFLGLVCEEYGRAPGSVRNEHERRQSMTTSPSLVMTFHNNAFRKENARSVSTQEQKIDDYYPQQALLFIDAYFKNLHYMHPIIDRTDFMPRCEDLWSGNAKRQPRSFVALYYSILALGALIRTWDQEQINGMGRFEWSRKLYQMAEDALVRPGTFNDVYTVQAIFTLAKICQNELNPNLAYTYLGMAVRSALSVGLNRNGSLGRNDQVSQAQAATASKVWWGIYSLEVEMSFALGRPDTTGMDVYHNREVPPIDDSEYAIIPIMLQLCRSMRNISTGIYLTKENLAMKLAKALQLEGELDAWFANLPPRLKTEDEPNILSQGPPEPEIWRKLHRLVLKLRYFNVKMILFRPFLLQAAKRIQTQQLLPADLIGAVKRCAIAAASTIDIMHATFQNHIFFRTWWYNATYTMFAASIMLFCAAQTSFPDLIQINCLTSSEKALEILDAMADAVVAKNVANFLRPIVGRLRKRNERTAVTDAPVQGSAVVDPPYLGVPGFDPSTWTGTNSDLDFFQTGMSFIDGGLWDYDMTFDETAQYDALNVAAVGHIYPT